MLPTTHKLHVPDEPNSDELYDLLATTATDPVHHLHSTPASLTDDQHAWNQVAAEQKRLSSNTVVQHRLGTSHEVFRSDPHDLPSWQQAMAPNPFVTSSPPPTPSPQKKRKFTDVDGGKATVAPPAKAQRVFYGINIHQLLDEAKASDDAPKPLDVTLPTPPAEQTGTKRSGLLWTEKYRARKFTDLIGDERTHRDVMKWLKRWDPIVFPGAHRPSKRASRDAAEEEKPHRKILLLTGPPGLGKTTLAHVCAKQAGYEVQEINASDERSSNVVKGRIRDMVGTENVRGVHTGTAGGKVRKAGKPVCVVVDEVDGAVGGSGGSGEGGFIKSLIDLVTLDHKNTASALGRLPQAPVRRKKGDRFRLLRPMILICNDVYHPALRPLRQGPHHAELIHVRKPPLQALALRLQSIFARENVSADADAVRRLCEATWGVSTQREDRGGAGGAGEGDMRGIMVVAEGVAAQLRATAGPGARLTRPWVEEYFVQGHAHGGGSARGSGRGGPKDIVQRVFLEGAGFPKSSLQPPPPSAQRSTLLPNLSLPNLSSIRPPAPETSKTLATTRLRDLLDSHADHTERIITDVWTAYPARAFQDDTLLSKPAAAYEWLHFHDALSAAVHGSGEWELAPYLSTPVLGLHHLFASSARAAPPAPDEPSEPLAGPQAPWHAHELHRHNAAALQTLHTHLSAPLRRAMPAPGALPTDLLPYLLRLLSPNIHPVFVGGHAGGHGAANDPARVASVRKASEQRCLARAVRAMAATGVRFERTRVTAEEGEAGGARLGPGANQWVYRMEPAVDALATFATGGHGDAGGADGGRTRFAVRQVLEQEWRREEARRAEEARMARFRGEGKAGPASSLSAAATGAKGGHGVVERLPPVAGGVTRRDFFGRAVASTEGENSRGRGRGNTGGGDGEATAGGGGRVWVKYHEGFSNAVRKPVTLGM